MTRSDILIWIDKNGAKGPFLDRQFGRVDGLAMYCRTDMKCRIVVAYYDNKLL